MGELFQPKQERHEQIPPQEIPDKYDGDEKLFQAVIKKTVSEPLTEAQGDFIKKHYPDDHAAFKRIDAANVELRDSLLRQYDEAEPIWYETERIRELLDQMEFQYKHTYFSKPDDLNMPLFEVERAKLKQKSEVITTIDSFIGANIEDILDYASYLMPYDHNLIKGFSLGVFEALTEEYKDITHLLAALRDDPNLLQNALLQTLDYIKENGFDELRDAVIKFGKGKIMDFVEDANKTDGKSIGRDLGYVFGQLLPTFLPGGQVGTPLKVTLSGLKTVDIVTPQLVDNSEIFFNRETYTAFMKGLSKRFPDMSPITIRQITEKTILLYYSHSESDQSDIFITLTEMYIKGDIDAVFENKKVVKFLVDIAYELDDCYLNDFLYNLLKDRHEDDNIDLVAASTFEMFWYTTKNPLKYLSKDQVYTMLGLT